MAKITEHPSKKDALNAISVHVNAFVAALEQTRAHFETTQSRPREMSRHASRSALEASWRESLVDLRTSFDEADECAQALIFSIKAALSLE